MLKIKLFEDSQGLTANIFKASVMPKMTFIDLNFFALFKRPRWSKISRTKSTPMKI